MTPDEIKESRKICDAAGDNPLEMYCATVVDLLVKKCVVRSNGEVVIPKLPLALGSFIVHARTALPKALDRIEELEAERDEAVIRAAEMAQAYKNYEEQNDS